MAHKLTVWKQNDFAENCKTVWVLPDSLKTFRMVSKLSGSFQKVSKLSRQFQNWSNISRWSKKFPEDSKAGGIFPNDLKLSSQVWKLLGWFQIFQKFLKSFESVLKLSKTHEELDQVYCAWLIKWVVKREIIQLDELCITRWWMISGTWWYWVSIWPYWLVLDKYMLVLLGIKWHRVSKGLVCLYILEKVEIWSGDTDVWHTYRQQNIELLSLSTV